jgi:hypothetical protein
MWKDRNGTNERPSELKGQLRAGDAVVLVDVDDPRVRLDDHCARIERQNRSNEGKEKRKGNSRSMKESKSLGTGNARCFPVAKYTTG